jgi:hypothetical protein
MEALRRLILLGKAKGSVTHDEIDAHMPPELQSEADVDAWLEALAQEGIAVVGSVSDDLLPMICGGIERMHDDAARADFLRALHPRLDEVQSMLGGAPWTQYGLKPDYVPTFLHGGSSDGRWVVMGINPGADHFRDEHELKRRSADDLVTFHERFFTEFPRLRPNAKQPWWTRLYRVTRVLEGDARFRGAISWDRLQAGSCFVVQDLIPFHSERDLFDPAAFVEPGPLRDLAHATLRGLKASRARGILVLSKAGYRAFAGFDLTARRDFVLRGVSTTGKPRRVDGYIARLGAIPVVALNNQILTMGLQIPYEQLLPALLTELARDGLV